MSYQTVRAFFNTAIQTWAAAQSPAVQVAWEDVPFTPTLPNSYVEVFLIPAVTLTATVKADRFRELGIYQVNLYTKAGVGTNVQDGLVSSLIAAFPITPKGVVSIEQQPYATKIKQEMSGYKCCAVTINYRLEV